MSETIVNCQRTDYSRIRELVEEEGRQKFSSGYNRIVFTNGCFDLFHPGHLIVLNHARGLAGSLGAVVVGINSDDSVTRLKGAGRPILNELARAHILLSLRQVDNVVTFYEDTPEQLVAMLQPDIIVKGGDYKDKKIVGREYALAITSDYDNNWSTTKIIEKIKDL